MRTEKKLPNISDVARAAGVSTATVSHTLNGTRTVSEHSRELVMKAIRELGYTPNAFARSFRTGKKNIIGFVVPDISNQFFARLIETVESSISAEGFHLIIANTQENKERELQHLRYLTSGVVDGILLASTMESYSEFSAGASGVLPHCFGRPEGRRCAVFLRDGVRVSIRLPERCLADRTGAAADRLHYRPEPPEHLAGAPCGVPSGYVRFRHSD